jgi:phosphoglycolate phosphatase
VAKNIVFDLDGTLANSLGCAVLTTQLVFERQDLEPPDPEAIRSRIGLPLSRSFRELASPEAMAVLQELIEAYHHLYPEVARTHERLYDGAMDLVKSLFAEGRGVAIATGKSHRGAQTSTKRLGLFPYFTTVHGIVPGTPGKPDPAVLRRAIEALGAQRDEVVMIGDTTYDLDMARALGVRACGVTWGVHSAERLATSEPEIIVDTFEALAAWVRT